MNEINPEKFTEKSIEAINQARELALQRKNTEILQVHLLSSLISQESGIVGSLLNRFGADKRTALELGVSRALDSLPRVEGSTSASPYVSTGLTETLKRADAIAKQMRDEYISTEHLFIAIVEAPEPAQIASLFRSLQITRSGVEEIVSQMRGATKVTSKTP